MISTAYDIVPFPRLVMADPLAYGAGVPGMTILLIDPNEDDRTHYAKALRACSTDYLVLEAPDGRSGLELYRSHRIDCIVLEPLLPDMDALEILSTVVPKAYGPTVAVVCLARWTTRGLSDLLLQKGAQACVTKSETSGRALERVIQKAMDAITGGPKMPDFLQLN